MARMAREKLLQSQAWLRTLSNTHSRLCLQERTLLFDPGLFSSNGPDEDSENGLGHNVSNRVANLLVRGCIRTRKTDHLDDVYPWVCQPRDDSQVPRSRDQARRCAGSLLARGIAQADNKLEDNVAEGHHGTRPPEPTDGQVILDLTRVAQGNHHSRRDTQAP